MDASVDGDPAFDLVSTSMQLADQIDRCLEVFEANTCFLVASHTSPDGDAIGATLAVGGLLEALGKEVVYYNRDPVPYNFGFLAGAAQLVTYVPEGAPIDVTVVVDCADPKRVGADFPDRGWGPTTVVIDHHKTWDPNFAQAYVRDPAAAATGELIYRLVGAAGVELTADIAEALYCCLMTDTASFRYSSTSRATFRIAGELIDAGVEPWKMTSHIYENEPPERLDLLARVLQTFEVAAGGRLAFLRIERSMFEATATGPGLTDGFINYARAVRGVEVATQLVECEDDVWRVTFRSRGKVDVSELAAVFGGGGHHNAAGCVIEASSDDIVARLSRTLVEQLDSKGAPPAQDT